MVNFTMKNIVNIRIFSVISAILFFFAGLPALVTAQEIGRFSFNLTNKIMEDGTIMDSSVGMNYTGDFSGEVRFRRTKTEKNEEFDNVDDSLNASAQEILEITLLPFNYSFIKTSDVKLWAGIGGYYYDRTLKEKGYFTWSILDDLFDLDPLNSYKNDFSMRTLGPIIDAGFTYRGSDWIKLSLSGGIVPIFATWAKQTVSIFPLMDPDTADYSQNLSGSPYLYGDLSGTISLPKLLPLFRNQGFSPSNWKLWVSLLYDYSRLKYEDLGFNLVEGKFVWIMPEVNVVTQSFKLEGALLIPLGGMHFQIGAGRIFDSMTADSGVQIRKDKNYLNIAGKLLNF